MAIPGISEVSALTQALEIGDPLRIQSIRQAISCCGPCRAQKESAGKEQRGLISKKRNKHLQTMLVQADKIAPRWSIQLASVHEREMKKGTKPGRCVPSPEGWP